MPRRPPICPGTHHILSWRRKLCHGHHLLLSPRPAQSTGRPCSLPGAQGANATGEQQRARPQLLPHQGCTGPAELCSRTTPDPSELIFTYNVSQDLRAQVRKRGNLLRSTLSHKNKPRDKVFQPLTAGRDEQMGTKSRGLFSVWANPFECLHSPAIK